MASAVQVGGRAGPGAWWPGRLWTGQEVTGDGQWTGRGSRVTVRRPWPAPSRLRKAGDVMVAWSPTGVSVSRGVKRERTKFREGWARYPVDGRQRGEGVEVRFIPRGRENGPGTSFCQTLNGGDQSSGHFRPWWGVCPVPLPRVLARRIYTPPAPQYAGPPEGRGTASLGPTCLSPRCVQNWPGAGSVGPVVVVPRMRGVAVSQGSSLALPPWPPVLNRLAVQPLSAGGGGGGGMCRSLDCLTLLRSCVEPGGVTAHLARCSRLGDGGRPPGHGVGCPLPCGAPGAGREAGLSPAAPVEDRCP